MNTEPSKHLLQLFLDNQSGITLRVNGSKCPSNQQHRQLGNQFFITPLLHFRHYPAVTLRTAIPGNVMSQCFKLRSQCLNHWQPKNTLRRIANTVVTLSPDQIDNVCNLIFQQRLLNRSNRLCVMRSPNTLESVCGVSEPLNQQERFGIGSGSGSGSNNIITDRLSLRTAPAKNDAGKPISCRHNSLIRKLFWISINNRLETVISEPRLLKYDISDRRVRSDYHTLSSSQRSVIAHHLPRPARPKYFSARLPLLIFISVKGSGNGNFRRSRKPLLSRLQLQRSFECFGFRNEIAETLGICGKDSCIP